MQRIPAEHSITTFSSEHPPAARVQLGERFECATHDCYAGQISTDRVLRPQIDMADFNRATGPIYVAGVQAGDMLSLEIEAITLQPFGVMALSPGLGILGSQIATPSTRIIPIREGHAWLSDEIAIPIAPMVGVLGVAPSGTAVSTSWPGDHGGNLDTPTLQAGSALLLRAQNDGGLLAVGDLHAAQGEGELGGTGIEIGGSVRLRVTRSKHIGTLPTVVNQLGMSILGSADDLSTAITRAFDEAVTLMSGWHRLSWDDAYRLSSLVVLTSVSQLVNPLVTVRITIPRDWCPPDLFESEPND